METQTVKVNYTTTELDELKEYLDAGFTYKEIGEIIGRTKDSVRSMCQRQGWKSNAKKGRPRKNKTFEDLLVAKGRKSDIMMEKQKSETYISSSKEKTLKDFTPREIIKHLYNLGYRIKDNKLVCLVEKVVIDEQVVNLKDIINA